MAAAVPPSGSANGRACRGLMAPPPGCAGALTSLVSSWGSYPCLEHPKRASQRCRPYVIGLEGKRLCKDLKGDTRNAECKLHPLGGERRWAGAPRRSGHRVAQPGTHWPGPQVERGPEKGTGSTGSHSWIPFVKLDGDGKGTGSYLTH